MFERGVAISEYSGDRLQMSKETQFQRKKDLVRKRLLKYTRRAFRMLPRMDRPRILDVGCGSGVPTTELAKLSQGEVIGIDIHQPSLDRLTRKIKQAGLSDCVKALKCSMEWLLIFDYPAM